MELAIAVLFFITLEVWTGFKLVVYLANEDIYDLFWQLVQEFKKGRAFDGWSEGTLNFAPTYKYEFKSEKYYGEDPKAGRRTPAWYAWSNFLNFSGLLINFKWVMLHAFIGLSFGFEWNELVSY